MRSQIQSRQLIRIRELRASNDSLFAFLMLLNVILILRLEATSTLQEIKGL